MIDPIQTIQELRDTREALEEHKIRLLAYKEEADNGEPSMKQEAVLGFQKSASLANNLVQTMKGARVPFNISDEKALVTAINEAQEKCLADIEEIKRKCAEVLAAG